MEPSEDIIALWRETFGEPPTVTADFETLSRILVEHMEVAPPYRPRPAPDSATTNTDPTSGTRNP